MEACLKHKHLLSAFLCVAEVFGEVHKGKSVAGGEHNPWEAIRHRLQQVSGDDSIIRAVCDTIDGLKERSLNDIFQGEGDRLTDVCAIVKSGLRFETQKRLFRQAKQSSMFDELPRQGWMRCKNIHEKTETRSQKKHVGFEEPQRPERKSSAQEPPHPMGGQGVPIIRSSPHRFHQVDLTEKQCLYAAVILLCHAAHKNHRSQRFLNYLLSPSDTPLENPRGSGLFDCETGGCHKQFRRVVAVLLRDTGDHWRMMALRAAYRNSFIESGHSAGSWPTSLLWHMASSYVRVENQLQATVLDWHRLGIQLPGDSPMDDTLRTSCPDWPRDQFIDLTLSDNRDVHLVPSVIFSLNKILVLDLSQCRLTNFNPAVFGLPRLHTLKLTNCHLTSACLAKQGSQLVVTPTLTTLELGSNELDDLPAGFKASRVVKLNLSKNKFTKVPDCVSMIMTLRHLYLNDNTDLKCLPPELCQLKELRTLGLRNAKIKLDHPLAAGKTGDELPVSTIKFILKEKLDGLGTDHGIRKLIVCGTPTSAYKSYVSALSRTMSASGQDTVLLDFGDLAIGSRLDGVLNDGCSHYLLVCDRMSIQDIVCHLQLIQERRERSKSCIKKNIKHHRCRFLTEPSVHCRVYVANLLSGNTTTAESRHVWAEVTRQLAEQPFGVRPPRVKDIARPTGDWDVSNPFDRCTCRLQTGPLYDCISRALNRRIVAATRMTVSLYSPEALVKLLRVELSIAVTKPGADQRVKDAARKLNESDELARWKGSLLQYLRCRGYCISLHTLVPGLSEVTATNVSGLVDMLGFCFGRHGNVLPGKTIAAANDFKVDAISHLDQRLKLECNGPLKPSDALFDSFMAIARHLGLAFSLAGEDYIFRPLISDMAPHNPETCLAAITAEVNVHRLCTLRKRAGGSRSLIYGWVEFFHRFQALLLQRVPEAVAAMVAREAGDVPSAIRDAVSQSLGSQNLHVWKSGILLLDSSGSLVFSVLMLPQISLLEASDKHGMQLLCSVASARDASSPPATDPPGADNPSEEEQRIKQQAATILGVMVDCAEQLVSDLPPEDDVLMAQHVMCPACAHDLLPAHLTNVIGSASPVPDLSGADGSEPFVVIPSPNDHASAAPFPGVINASVLLERLSSGLPLPKFKCSHQETQEATPSLIPDLFLQDLSSMTFAVHSESRVFSPREEDQTRSRAVPSTDGDSTKDRKNIKHLQYTPSSGDGQNVVMKTFKLPPSMSQGQVQPADSFQHERPPPGGQGGNDGRQQRSDTRDNRPENENSSLLSRENEEEEAERRSRSGGAQSSPTEEEPSSDHVTTGAQPRDSSAVEEEAGLIGVVMEIRKEARIHSLLNLRSSAVSPFIVDCVAACLDVRGFVGLATKDLGKTSLHKLIDDPTGLSRLTRHCIAAEMACAVTYLHRCGIIHRDIKADNVMVLRGHEASVLDSPGEPLSVLIDMGSATDAAVSNPRQSEGNVYYQSPDMLRLNARPSEYYQQTDLYSLALVFAELVAREHVVAGAGTSAASSNNELRTQLHMDTVEWAKWRPHWLEPLVLAFNMALNSAPAERPSARILRNFLLSQPSHWLLKTWSSKDFDAGDFKSAAMLVSDGEPIVFMAHTGRRSNQNPAPYLRMCHINRDSPFGDQPVSVPISEHGGEFQNASVTHIASAERRGKQFLVLAIQYIGGSKEIVTYSYKSDSVTTKLEKVDFAKVELEVTALATRDNAVFIGSDQNRVREMQLAYDGQLITKNANNIELRVFSVGRQNGVSVKQLLPVQTNRVWWLGQRTKPVKTTHVGFVLLGDDPTSIQPEMTSYAKATSDIEPGQEPPIIHQLAPSSVEGCDIVWACSDKHLFALTAPSDDCRSQSDPQCQVEKTSIGDALANLTAVGQQAPCASGVCPVSSVLWVTSNAGHVLVFTDSKTPELITSFSAHRGPISSIQPIILHCDGQTVSSVWTFGEHTAIHCPMSDVGLTPRYKEKGREVVSSRRPACCAAKGLGYLAVWDVPGDFRQYLEAIQKRLEEYTDATPAPARTPPPPADQPNA